MVPAMPTAAIPTLGMRTLGTLRPPLLLALAQAGLVAIASVAIPLVGLALRPSVTWPPIPPIQAALRPETLVLPGTVVMPVTAGMLVAGLLLLPRLPVVAGMRATPRALA